MDRFTDSFLSEVDGDVALRHRLRAERILGRSLLSKHLAGKHDQSSHGNWADNQVTVQDAGNGLSFRQIIHLQASSDRYQSKVYKAEDNLYPRDDANQPVAPRRDDFTTYDEYKTAWLKYAQDFTDWQTALADVQVSDLGKKYIDGTVKGIQKFYDEIRNSEWFIAEFGDGKGLPPLKIAVRKSGSYAGRHRFGIKISGAKGYQEINDIFISKTSAKSEPTLIHELAHYATMLKEDQRYEGHGVEFARNQLFIWEHVAGKEVADKLRAEYIKEGVPL